MDKFSLGYPEVPFSITNKTVSKNNAEDISEPFSLLEFIKHVASIVESNNIAGYYNFYLNKWNSYNNNKSANSEQLIIDTYRNFLKDISLNFTSEAEKQYLSQIDYSDKYDLDVALSFIARKIKEIALYYSKKREDIKLQVYRNKFSGSTKGLGTTIKEKIIDVLTNTLNKKQGYDIDKLSKQINVQVDELYSDETRIFNKTPNESDYEAKDLDYNLDIFLRDNQDLVKQVFSSTSTTFQALNEVDSIFDKKRELTKKYIGSDYYYVSATQIPGQDANLVYTSNYNITYNRQKISTPAPPTLPCKCFSAINYAQSATANFLENALGDAVYRPYSVYNLLSSQSTFSYIDCETREVKVVKMPVDSNNRNLLLGRNALSFRGLRNTGNLQESQIIPRLNDPRLTLETRGGARPLPSIQSGSFRADREFRNYNQSIGGYIFTGCAYNGVISGANFPETIIVSNTNCDTSEDCKIEVTTPTPFTYTPSSRRTTTTTLVPKASGGLIAKYKPKKPKPPTPKPKPDQSNCCQGDEIKPIESSTYKAKIPENYRDKNNKNCVKIDSLIKDKVKISLDPVPIIWKPTKCCEETHYEIFYDGFETQGEIQKAEGVKNEPLRLLGRSFIPDPHRDFEGSRGSKCDAVQINNVPAPEIQVKGCNLGYVYLNFRIRVSKLVLKNDIPGKDPVWVLGGVLQECKTRVGLQPEVIECCETECKKCYSVEEIIAIAIPSTSQYGESDCYRNPVKLDTTVILRRETSCLDTDETINYTWGDAKESKGAGEEEIMLSRVIEGACDNFPKDQKVTIEIIGQDGRLKKTCEFEFTIPYDGKCCENEPPYTPPGECPPCDEETTDTTEEDPTTKDPNVTPTGTTTTTSTTPEPGKKEEGETGGDDTTTTTTTTTTCDPCGKGAQRPYGKKVDYKVKSGNLTNNTLNQTQTSVAGTNATVTTPTPP